MLATGYMYPRIYVVAGGLELVMEHNQQGRQIQLTHVIKLYFSKPAIFTDSKGSSWVKSRLLHLCSRRLKVMRK
jgi:hypothetical protein